MLVLLTLPYSLGSRDLALAPEERPAPFDWVGFAKAFWVSPDSTPDFAWAWITRFLVNLGNALGLLYLLYLQDAVGIAKGRGRRPGVPADRDLRCGADGDRGRVRDLERPGRPPQGLRHLVRRRRNGRDPDARRRADLARGLAAAVLLGIGYGIYGVDFAMITQVLPGAGTARTSASSTSPTRCPRSSPPIIAGLLLIVVDAAGGRPRPAGTRSRSATSSSTRAPSPPRSLGSVFVTRIRSVP